MEHRWHPLHRMHRGNAREKPADCDQCADSTLRKSPIDVFSLLHRNLPVSSPLVDATTGGDMLELAEFIHAYSLRCACVGMTRLRVRPAVTALCRSNQARVQHVVAVSSFNSLKPRDWYRKDVTGIGPPPPPPHAPCCANCDQRGRNVDPRKM